MEQIDLCGADLGKTYQVVGMDLPRAAQMRLIALGLTEGTQLEVLNKKRGGAVIFHVRGTRLAVGKKIAEKISIRKIY